MTYSFEKPDLAILEMLMQSDHLCHQERLAMKSYKDKIDETTGYVRVDYEQKPFGRYVGYAKKGKGKNATKTSTTAASMRRQVRNLLFGESYDDIDIINASGTVMCQLLQKHHLPTEKLTYLNENREKVLEEIQSFHADRKLERMTAKDILIEVFFCGSGHSSQYWELNPFTQKRNSIVQYALPPFVEELKKEYLDNLEKLMDLPEYNEIRNYVIDKAEEKGKEAWIGQFASTLYQDEERKILDVLVEEVKQIGKDCKIDNPVGGLIYDGFHVKKEVEIRNHIKRLEKAVARKTDYDVKLEIKEMEAEIELAKCDLTYEALRDTFERTRFKTRKGKHPFRTIDPKDGVISWSKMEFQIAYEDWIHGGNQFLKTWFEDPDKRSYDNIEYACVAEEEMEDDIYYAFPTLRYKTLSSTSTEAERQDNIDFLENYLLAMAEEDPSYRNWLRMWLSDIVCRPYTKGAQPISVLLFGKPGAGKSTLTEMMRRILGTRLVHATSNPTANGDILSEFNAILKYKLFIEFEEINMKTHSSVADQIKALITQDYHPFTEKGKDAVSIKSTERFLFTTNTSGSVVVDKGDRRYVAFRVSNRFVGDTAYWNEFRQKLDNNNYIRDIADYLLNFKEETKTYAFRDKRPITAYYSSLQQMSLSPEHDFIRDTFLYHADELDTQGYKTKTGIYEIPSSWFSTYYNNWRDNHNLKESVSNKAFTMKMKTLGDTYGISHRVKMDHSVFVVDTNVLRPTIAKDFNIQV